MSKKFTTAGQLKKGDTVLIQGEPSKVTSVQISRPGKHGHAKVRFEGVGIIDEKKRVEVMPGHDRVEVPIIDKKSAQILSVNGDMANVDCKEMRGYGPYKVNFIMIKNRNEWQVLKYDWQP